MATKKELLSVTETVREILKERPAARDSDETLFCMVYYKLGYDFRLPFYKIMEAIQQSKLPTLESIRRCRQKLQQHYPELRGKKYQARMAEEEPYIEYAKGEV